MLIDAATTLPGSTGSSGATTLPGSTGSGGGGGTGGCLALVGHAAEALGKVLIYLWLGIPSFFPFKVLEVGRTLAVEDRHQYVLASCAVVCLTNHCHAQMSDEAADQWGTLKSDAIATLPLHPSSHVGLVNVQGAPEQQLAFPETQCVICSVWHLPTPVADGF